MIIERFGVVGASQAGAQCRRAGACDVCSGSSHALAGFADNVHELTLLYHYSLVPRGCAFLTGVEFWPASRGSISFDSVIYDYSPIVRVWDS